MNKLCAILISIGICSLAVISFMINWPVQFVVTGALYFLTGYFFAVKKVNATASWAALLLLVVPYILVYSIGAILTGNSIIYPIAAIGPLAGAVGYLLGRLIKPSNTSYSLLIAGLLLIALGYTGMKNWISYVRNPISQVNEAPPSVVFRDDKGMEVSLADLKGKTIVLDFWSTTCAPCVKKFPVLESLKNEYNADSGIVFASVYLPNVADPEDLVRTFGGHDKFTFNKLYAQNRRAWTDFKIPFLPYMVVIDKTFRIRYRGSFHTESAYIYINANKIIQTINSQ